MSPEDRDRHRSRIGFEVEVVLHSYWRADKDPLIRTAELAWWSDELEDWSIDQVQWALRRWCRDNPDRRPNPGHIVALLIQRRGQACAERMAAERLAKRAEEPAREPIDEETCKLRIAQLQATVRELGNAKRMPRTI